MARRKTGFDAYVERREKKSPTFAKELNDARREIEQVDAIVRALDEARVDVGMSKAELARAIGARPDALRRLFTADRANPTLETVARLCDALGFRLTVQPKDDTRGEATA